MRYEPFAVKFKRERDEARAELAATRSGPVAVGDCRNPVGIVVGLIDGVIAQSRLIAQYLRDAPHLAPDIREALADLRSDEDVHLTCRTPLPSPTTENTDPPACKHCGHVHTADDCFACTACDHDAGLPG